MTTSRLSRLDRTEAGIPREETAWGGTMATTDAAHQGDIINALDARTPTSFYWQLTILATIGGFLFGFDTANIGSALDFVPST